MDADNGKPPVALAEIPRLALSIPEAAKALSLGERTVEGLARTGQLRPVRVGRRVILSVADLRSWLASEAEKAGEAGD